MRFLLLAAFLLVCAAVTAPAQSLVLSSIDTSGFPLLKANLSAFDAVGKRVSPSASQLALTEDGTARTILSVTCPPEPPPQALSSVLVIDVSGSMGISVQSGTRLDLAKAAAGAWINALPLGTSECAIASFDDRNYLNQDFTTDRAKLLAAVGSLVPQGGTDYDQGLLLAAAGGLQIAKNGKHRKVVVFLTDGYGNSPQTAAIIAEAQRQNCIIFAVTLGMTCPSELQDISTQTGGEWFENVTTIADAEVVYRQILYQAQGGLPCQLTWQSDIPCKSGQRGVQVSWNGKTAQAGYTVPNRTVPELKMVPASLYLRSKPVAQKFDTTVTITAANYPTTVTGITSSNAAFDINPKSFTLAVGESRTLTVSYTPTDSSYRWTQFAISTDQCPRNYFAGGGYPGVRPVVRTIKLDDPNGGETFVSGSDTVITWSGIPMSDTVTLEYSTDQGASWKIVTTTATGGRYAWHVPNTPSNRCLVRVTQSAPSDGWAKQIDSAGYAGTGKMVVDADGNIYVTGSFQLTTNFWDKSLKSAGSRDLYLAKYRPDRTLEWIIRDGGPAYEQPFSMALDSMGNIYIVGEMLRGVSKFGGSNLVQSDSIDFYLAKYHAADGSFEWVQRTRGPLVERGIAVAVDAAGNPYVSIAFDGTIDFGTTQFTSTGYGKKLLLAKYHSDGSLEWVKNTGASADTYGFESGNSLAVDAAGNAFVTGYFSDTIDVGGITLKGTGTRGYDDILLAKYRPDGSVEWATSAGSDMSDQGAAVTFDVAGNIYLAGHCQDTAYFGPYTVISSSVLSDAFTAKYFPDGSVDWVRAGDGGVTTASAIALDPQGSVYTAGYFSTTTTFGTATLHARYTGFSSGDAFVVKYAPNGMLKWAKRAGGESSDDAIDIDVDGSGNIYVYGAFSERADFDGDTLGSDQHSAEYIWKLDENSTLQSDTSNAVFSIVQPSPSARSVDLGKVLIGAMKDSVVQTFITNTGAYPFRVKDIQITGTDASQFTLVSGIPPFDVPVGGAYPVEFRFKPTSIGVSSAQLEIVTQSETLTRSITGQGVTRAMTIISDDIDFGQVKVGDQKDSLSVVTVVSTGTAPLTFTGVRHVGPNDIDFQILGGTPKTLNRGDTLKLDLRFKPSAAGRTNDLLLLDYTGAVAPVVVQIFGEGISSTPTGTATAAIAANEAAAAPGDEIEIPILLNEGVNIAQSGATNLTATLRFNATLLDPIGNTPRGTISGDERVIPLELPIAPQSGNVLTTLRFRAMLGNDTATALKLENPGAVGGTVTVSAESGTFRLLGVCKDGGVRLLNPTGQVGIVKLAPNPVNERAELEIETLESGPTHVTLLNLQGQVVTTLYDGIPAPGHHIVSFDTHELSAGSYYVVLATPTVQRMQRIDIVK